MTLMLSASRIAAFWASEAPNLPCVTDDNSTITWAEFEKSTNRLARAYEDLGVKEGDMVTIALPNGIEFFEATFAAFKLGATPQPISNRLPRIERDAIIEIADPSLVVGVNEGDIMGRAWLPENYKPDETLSDGFLPEKTSRYWKAPTSGGSTGRPKLIVAEQPAIFDPYAPTLRMQVEGVILMPGPLYHNAPFAFSCSALFRGNHVVITSRFDSEKTLALVEEHKVGWLYLVPTMMQRIWKLPKEARFAHDLSSLEIVLHLAAPCPAWLKEEWINWLGGERIHELYAGTEAQGSTWITGTEWLEHRGSVGRPAAHCQMKIVGEEGETLPPGEIGEVYMIPVNGQGTTYHYVGADPKADGEGWESIGDMGYMDEEGYLYLADRQTDMILCGGANVYPAEVEGAVEAFGGVRSCAVIGLPDEDLGNRVHAIVDMAGHEFDEEALQAHLTERLSRYKIPRTFEVVNEPLRSDAGKVRRKDLRAERL